jgi:hypothetical protein
MESKDFAPFLISTTTVIVPSQEEAEAAAALQSGTPWIKGTLTACLCA